MDVAVMVARALDAATVEYLVGGSVASTRGRDGLSLTTRSRSAPRAPPRLRGTCQVVAESSSIASPPAEDFGACPADESRCTWCKFLAQRVMVPFGDVTAEMKSYGARDAAERKALLSMLRDLAPAGAVKIRPLGAGEMKVVWPFITWDLTEPIFVVESGERKWVVDFDETGTAPFWIEDLTAPCFTAAQLKGKCLCAQAKKVGGDWKLAFVEGKQCVEGAPRQASANPLGLDPALADLMLVKFLVPDAEMGKRITVEALGGYVKRLMATVTKLARAQQGRKTGALTVRIAVKPGGEHRVWLTSAKRPAVAPAFVESLGAAMREVPAPEPLGTIIFQMHLQLWGGAKVKEDAFPNIPVEWQEIVNQEKGPIDAESLVDKAWSAGGK